MVGAPLTAIIGDSESSPISFFLEDDGGRVALRSKRPVGRRFNLARLIGDLITHNSDGRLFPATQAHTYRQKLQRAFAAEFLCPFEAMADMLHGDFSPEAIEEVASYFDVSEMTVQTLLVNHGLLDREVLEGDFEFRAVA
jgi:Zn-dependent peptidase ImmA (M78 family)